MDSQPVTTAQTMHSTVNVNTRLIALKGGLYQIVVGGTWLSQLFGQALGGWFSSDFHSSAFDWLDCKALQQKKQKYMCSAEGKRVQHDGDLKLFINYI